ncbi:MAG: glycosyl hydrolase [Spirochaetia bacterium]
MAIDFEREFKNPGCWYRGQPFWAWNGALDPEELRRQIRLMKRMGLGGFFMHSRVGLATPYLKEEWFRCTEACIDEARKQGMLAWLYDEDRWPSGAAGGLVTKDESWRRRSLCASVYATPAELKWTADTVAAFVARVKGAAAARVRQIPRGKKPPALGPAEKIVAFRVALERPSSWYNDAAYLDTLNPAAVKKFIAVTHESYRARVGRHFGATVPGIFSDEPNHGRKLAANNTSGSPLDLPWTAGLPAAFRKRYGYDLIPRLMELFYDVDGREITPARHDYHDCVTALFVDSFSRQIGQWCEENHLQFTGHVLMEDRLSEQADVAGSALRFYEHMQAPGMDLLTERWRAFATAKQVSSVARQLGRKWRITETYGCTGWDFPFAGHKSLGDWQVALGITMRCQHLAWYTMEGEAKRDYPAAISAQSPWWELYPEVEDYFARVLAAMTRGEEVRDVLVIHPVESTWTMIKRGWKQDPRVLAYDRALVDIEDTLLGAHLDFDYGDEEMLGRLGAVSRKKGAPLLLVGRAGYTVVVVPALLTVRSSTLKLLDEFRTAGGIVVFAGQPAGHVDALPSEEARTLAGRCVAAPAAGPGLSAAVEKAGRRISILDNAGREIAPALYLLREDRRAYYLFICNTGFTEEDRKRDILDQNRAVERASAFPMARITTHLQSEGAPRELDPRTGGISAAEAARREDGGWEITTSLPALGSRLFELPKSAEAPAAMKPKLVDARRIEMQDGRWTIARTEPNVLVLDTPEYRIAGGAWQGPEEVLRVDRQVRSALGVSPRGGQMVQPWARKGGAGSKSVAVELRYTIVVETLVTGRLSLALESPRRWTITFNGQPLLPDMDSGWWVDPSLRMLSLDTAIVRRGVNELVLACHYNERHPGLEIAYLLGDFGVEVEGAAVRVIDAPRSLALGDWTAQGLPFYSGNLCYCRSVSVERGPADRVFIQVPDYRGVAVRVLVNGTAAGVIGWEPNEVEITGLLPEGQSAPEIRIEIAGHRRNSHGPLHLAQKWPAWTGPAQFTSTGAEWIDEYQLVPCGLMKPPAIVIRRERRT